jgi:hypothetical protein
LVPNELGRRVPPDFEHVVKYQLAKLPIQEQPVGVPVAIGINWYSNFDRPVLDQNRYWIGRGDLGHLRGGHCVCLPSKQRDYWRWWDFYDQGQEGACVGFGCSRMMSLLNRHRVNPWWLWDRAKETDDWADTNPGDSEGTSVRAALDILRLRGHVNWINDQKGLNHVQRATLAPTEGEGISAFRWASSVDEIIRILDHHLVTDLNAVPILNSWGRDYPHKVWMPLETLNRVLHEEGEFGLITDR